MGFNLHLQNLVVEHIGGDGDGMIQIGDDITMDLAADYVRTHIQSSLYINGIVTLPTTTYAEQYVTNEGHIVGVEHWYSRGHTKFVSTGQSSCSSAQHRGQYYFTSVTTLSDGGFSMADDSSFSVTDAMTMFTDTFRMEGQSHSYIIHSANVMGRVFEIEKQSILDGNGEGYLTAAGIGPGQSCSCGSGGGHGGAGGSCTGCGSCNGGSAYDSNILPSQSGSGGGLGTGGCGGSAVRLVHTFTVVEGMVTMNGDSSLSGGGGGAGGSVWVDADVVAGWGYLYAKGGSGSQSSCYHNTNQGGGGGGGRVRSYGKEYTSKVVKHQMSVAGGTGYRNGGEGSKYISHGGKCSGYGSWNTANLLCHCDDDHVGLDCQFYCNATTTCGGNGLCNEHGQCECSAGFVGTHCDSPCTREDQCSGNGDCSTCGACVCDPCFSGSECSIQCGGFGLCGANQCVCDSCHLGVLCGSECNGHGTCSEAGNCSCDDNWGDDKCTKKGCPGVDLNCNGNGICNSGDSKCYCSNGWTGKNDFFLGFQCYG